MKSPIRSTLMATRIATATLGAWAQSAPAPAAGSTPAAATAPAHPGMHDRMLQHMARHLEKLKAQLKLAPEQQSAWAAYAQALTPPKDASHPMHHGDLASLTTPERLDRMKQMHQEHEAAWQQRDQATRALYSALNDDQKKTFDRETLPHWHGHHDGAEHAPR